MRAQPADILIAAASSVQIAPIVILAPSSSGSWHRAHHAGAVTEMKKAAIARGPFWKLVETRRIELPTFALRTRRSPS